MSTKLLFALSLSPPALLAPSFPPPSAHYSFCSAPASAPSSVRPASLCYLLPFVSFHFISFHPVPFRYSTLSVCRRLQPASVRYCYALGVCEWVCERVCVCVCVCSHMRRSTGHTLLPEPVGCIAQSTSSSTSVKELPDIPISNPRQPL